MKAILSADQIVRLGTGYISNFFSKGWGDVDLLRRLSKFQADVLNNKKLDEIYKVIDRTNITILKVQVKKKINSSIDVYRGSFRSPLVDLLPNALPVKSEQVNFEVVVPANCNKPSVCIHLAGTGDHHFWWRKKNMAIPLAEEYKIASIILENPFYGQRKPSNQVRSSVNYVSDIFVMGCALLVECATLFSWSQKNNFGSLGITGISMGAHMATVASCGWRGPLAVVPCLSWTSAAPIYTEGVLYSGVHWKILEKQLKETPEYHELIRKDTKFKQHLYNQYKSNKSANFDINYLTKKLIPIDIDFMKYVEPIQKQVYNSTFKKINLDPIKGLFNIPSQEALDYMTAIMDQATHLAHFNKPHKDSAIIYVVGEHDKYINRDFYNVTPKDVWPQTEVRTIDCGHVVGCIMHQKIFCQAINDAFSRLPKDQLLL